MPNTRSHSSHRTEQFHDAPSTQLTPGPQQGTVLQPIANLKLPQFWTLYPQAWFVQVDSLFELHNVNNDNTKFQHVISSLSQEVILKVLSFIQNPPNINKYEALKNTLCEKYSLSEGKRLEDVISDTLLGDKTPSELYDEMITLSEPLSFVSHDLIFKLWQRKLPHKVQEHLLSSGLQSIKDIVALADKIYQMEKPNICSVNSSESKSSQILQNVTQLTSNLSESINKIALDIAELKNKEVQRSRFEFPKRTSQHNYNHDICWYHQHFGKRALKCIKPCKYFREFQSKALN